MKLALLPGNRFNPWHHAAFAQLPDTAVTVFRAASEIQQRYAQIDDTAWPFAFEPIEYSSTAGPMPVQLWQRACARWLGRAPRLLPFHERLRGFDVLQTWELFTDWTAQALDARQRDGTPTAVMVWDNIPFNMEARRERRELKQRTAREADRFIVHTDRSARMLTIEGVAPERIDKIGPGVDTQRFAPGPRDRARFGLRDEDFVILFVGWLLPRKGIDFLLLAMRELLADPALAARRPRLLAVGDALGRPRVDQLIQRLGLQEAVHFAGPVPYGQMPEAFRAADVFVLPSIAMPDWQEQFGMALLEAMACGVPAVSTYSGAIPEITGDDALLCQPNDFVALYEALRRLLLEPGYRSDLAARGQARVHTHFTQARLARDLAAIYAGLRRR